MFQSLTVNHAFSILDRVRTAVEDSSIRSPIAGEGEESYVANILAPVVRRCILKLSGLTLHGEGLQRAAPAYYLGYHMYPDLAIMHYGQRIVAVEAKFVDFSRAKGALSTAIGQTVIYSRSGYLTSLGVLIGAHAHATQVRIDEENRLLTEDGARWRICSPRLMQA